MNLFYQISTEEYVSLSHDNSYLFAHYDRVHNFIKTRLDRKFQHILAKPIKRNYDIDWFSSLENLQFDNHHYQAFALDEYWKFKELLDKDLESLSVNPDSDTKNWIELLRKVFNHEDNLIFSNGTEIAIIWGWKFENNSNRRPVLQEFLTPSEEVEKFATESELILPAVEAPVYEDFPEINEEEVEEKPFEEEEVFEELPVEIIEVEKHGFLEFLKEFAAKYWWLLIVLLALIALVYLIKTIS